ncbi:MAG: diguanylate cyclase [Rhodospirillales bacterium]|nr:diguanylate cyclase [Rhodospirillales bacterium]
MAEDFRTPDLYRKELARMEVAMRDQVNWLKDWHLKVFADLDSEEMDTEGLTLSPFRAWYRGLSKDLFSESPIFAALGFALESMQSLANQLVQEIQDGNEFPEEGYRDFMDAVSNFNELVFKLMREALNRIAHVDDLTGVGNETGMRAHISSERERVRRTVQHACVAVAELGRYSIIDDEDGDGATDIAVSRAEVITQFAAAVSDMLRPYDQLYRIDNDNFMLCLPYTDVDVANLVVNRLHAFLVSNGLVMEDGSKVRLEMFFGIAPIRPDDEIEQVLEHSCQALELAQENALLNVVAWEEPRH